jgi:hypothetical protein
MRSGKKSGGFFMSRILVVVFLILFCNVSESISGTEYTPEAQFATLYAQVLRSVVDGSLSQSVAKEARLINVDLQKKLAEFDNRIKVLKNDTLEQKAAQRQQAVEELIEVVARKERVIFIFLQKLGKLSMLSSGQGGHSDRANTILDNVVVFDMRVDGGAGNKQHEVVIESFPEDISTGEFD